MPSKFMTSLSKTALVFFTLLSLFPLFAFATASWIG